MNSLRLAARRLARRPVTTAVVALLTGATLAAAGLIGVGLSSLSSVGPATDDAGVRLAFLDPTLSEAGRAKTLRRIEALTGVAHARLLSPEQLVRDVRETLKDTPELVEGVDARWMPAAVEITTVAGPDGAGVGDALAATEGITDVQGADLPGGAVDRLRALRDVARVGGWTLLALLAAAAAALVAGLAGLQAQRSREESDLMRIFGATEVFVRLPLVLEGGLVGGLGGLVACAAVAAVVAAFRAALGMPDPGFAGAPVELPAAWSWAVYILAGPVLGAGGAAIAAGRADSPAV